eukprot:CAMPEP_0115881464 /NCGR_PEP_ID=MMETSP0287-20121206/28451_1 /TAXON_ID=412157 /ORGANISM="Chrysochromulina rotalis, Strain UIO044" /LENGTH=51 /DNA_ID=CAMNT_0003337409 /DNA_START=363 /DNA_END=514 /DNA_ORIENTATION=-
MQVLQVVHVEASLLPSPVGAAQPHAMEFSQPARLLQRRRHPGAIGRVVAQR